MLLIDFINAYEAGVDKKTLSKMIKTLPVEDRKEAGMLFKTLGPEVKQIKAKIKDNLGPLLESYDIGPFGYGLYIYENRWRVPVGRKEVIVTGTNLKFKVIK